MVGGKVAVTLTALLMPPQLDTVMVPLPCNSYVAGLLPCGLIKDAAGEVLQVNGPVPDAVIVTCPPIQAVNGVAGKVGAGI